jgi:hypothetical protein
VAGRPLRPATDRRHGGPLPPRLANPPQAPPGVARAFPQAPSRDLSVRGITPRFRGLPPAPGQVAHALLTRPPRDPPERGPVRLACIRHAASVHPEPGSNSPPRSVPPCRRNLWISELRFGSHASRLSQRHARNDPEGSPPARRASALAPSSTSDASTSDVSLSKCSLWRQCAAGQQNRPS